MPTSRDRLQVWDWDEQIVMAANSARSSRAVARNAPTPSAFGDKKVGHLIGVDGTTAFRSGLACDARGASKGSTALSAEARRLWEETVIRKALGAQADRLLDDAVEVSVSSGEIIYEVEKDGTPPLIIVVAGLIRVFVASAHGRQATIRYVKSGDMLGLPVLLAPTEVGAESGIAVQSMMPTSLMYISGQKFRDLISSHANNLWPMFSELVRSMIQSFHLLSENVFQPVKSRIALHLLDLGERRGDELAITASQQDIADAVGTVREVVSRVIIMLKNEGLIERKHNHYVILDPKRLYEIGCHSF